MRVSTVDLGGGEVVLTQQAGNLAALLSSRGAAMTAEWRKRYYSASDERLRSTAMLDGVVEPLLAELGRSLDEPTDLPASAWGRTAGLLRLSPSRGAEGLAEEFEVLRRLLEEAAEQVRAPLSQRKRARVLLDASQAQALALLRRCLAQGDEPVPPAGRFGGVIVETT